MAVSSSNISFILIVVLNVVQGTLTPNGNVSVDCGSTQTFDCAIPDEPIEWTTSGLRGISQGPFRARVEAIHNSRMTSPDEGDTAQFSVSSITVSGFSRSDNGGTIQCINAENNTVRGMARISVGLRAPANIVARADSCDTINLQWTLPSKPNDITTSVSCTPPSPGCAECSSSPCNITGLSPSTEYVFTVTLNSVMCGTSMNTAGIGTRDSCVPDTPSTNTSAPLAALVLLVLLIPLLYPLGVLVAYLVFFKDKSYCEVFWCCFCCRKDTIYWMNSIELREHREENVYQDLPKKKVVNTGNVMQQQGNPDGTQYADLDFSEQGTGRNVIHTRVDPVTYAEMS